MPLTMREISWTGRTRVNAWIRLSQLSWPIGFTALGRVNPARIEGEMPYWNGTPLDTTASGRRDGMGPSVADPDQMDSMMFLSVKR